MFESNKLKSIKKIKEAGVVGAGGAGFPAFIKLQKKVDIVIVNGAECEPLLWKDKYLLEYNTKEIVDGLKAVMNIVEAEKGIIALKRKSIEITDLVKSAVKNENNIEIFLLDDFYPSGDEHILVNEITSLLVPEGRIPLDIGILVNNVETILNIKNALEGISVTRKTIAVMGAVKNPKVINVPIGISVNEVIALAGGTTVSDFSVISGGPMTGEIIDNLDITVNKITSAIIVLPSDSFLIMKKAIPFERNLRLSLSVCIQCTECTVLCPRHLLGHSIKPHEIMRSVNYRKVEPVDIFTASFLCSECGVCEIYSCIMGISPKMVYSKIKKELSLQGIKNSHNNKVLLPDRFLKERRIPISRLVNRLRLSKYDITPDYNNVEIIASNVRINLHQHYGIPAKPVVRIGDLVDEGEIIGKVPDDKIGAYIHASIKGRITNINNEYIDVVRS